MRAIMHVAITAIMPSCTIMRTIAHTITRRHHAPSNRPSLRNHPSDNPLAVQTQQLSMARSRRYWPQSMHSCSGPPLRCHKQCRRHRQQASAAMTVTRPQTIMARQPISSSSRQTDRTAS
jgi:hypothetical protein